jgi:hypothetical protein
MLLVGGVILTLAGFLIVVYWHFIVAGLVLFSVLFVFQHHTVAKVESPVEVASKSPVIDEPPSNKDESFQKTSIIDPIWLFTSLMRLRELNQLQQATQSEKPSVTPVVETKQIVETPEMREYVKNCTELTNDAKLCRDNWIAVNEAGAEIILEPVERKSIKQVNQTKTKVDKNTVNNPVLKSPEIKLLDVDNKEYKERRAAALSKPDAVVFQEVYR